MKILLASDHAGFEYKQKLKEFLLELGYEAHDEGAFTLDANDDYPDFISVVAKQVSSDPDNIKGIILGGSGQGEAMTANRYKNVRATVYYGGDKNIITLSRDHNNSNILSLGARFMSLDEAKQAVKDWLQIPFSGDPRHIRRIQKIDNLVQEENSF